jgi:hypothetical protein
VTLSTKFFAASGRKYRLYLERLPRTERSRSFQAMGQVVSFYPQLGEADPPKALVESSLDNKIHAYWVSGEEVYEDLDNAMARLGMRYTVFESIEEDA